MRCSITGGVVVRDPRLPALDGRYLWSDLCDGQLYAIDPSATTIAEQPLGLSANLPTSFGTDALDRVYVATPAATSTASTLRRDAHGLWRLTDPPRLCRIRFRNALSMSSGALE